MHLIIYSLSVNTGVYCQSLAPETHNSCHFAPLLVFLYFVLIAANILFICRPTDPLLLITLLINKLKWSMRSYN